MKIKYISIVAISALCLCVSPAVVAQSNEMTPTTELGNPNDDVSNLRLKPGKLIGLPRLSEEAAMTNVVKQDMCFDAMLSDKYFATSTYTEAQSKQMFIDGAAMIEKTGAEIWGVHMPYNTNGKSNIDAADAATLKNLKKIMGWTMQYLKPKHIVFHPGNTVVYISNQTNFNAAKKTAREALVELQVELDALNAKYGTNAIICVENCTKKVAYDPLSLLDLLDYPGLERVKICFDTGHALIPQNGGYSNKDDRTVITRNGDVIEMLKVIGTRLGTLHITQNHGGIGVTATDEHLEPFVSDLVDWGEFYHTLLTHNCYRGCFLYETNYETTYKGGSSTVSTCRDNYNTIIVPQYERYLSEQQ